MRPPRAARVLAGGVASLLTSGTPLARETQLSNFGEATATPQP